MVIISPTVSSPSFNTAAAAALAPVPAAEVARLTSGAFSLRNCSFLSARCSRSRLLCVSKCFRGMAESIEDRKRDFSTAAVTAAENGSGRSASQSPVSLNFIDFRTEEDLLSAIKNAVQAGTLPLNVSQGMEELYQNYRDAVCKSGHPKAYEVALTNTAVAFDRVFIDVKDPFEFSPYHKAIREPFDYYLFGQNYIRPLIDFDNSYVGNISVFHEIEEKLKKGENIVLMSNHQSEADPAVIAWLLESTNPYLSENMTYVAGDRVITDPLCKPFSMGRNLICVYSKKHLFDDPERIEIKKKEQTRSLKEMALLLRRGSQLIWIAPSGGRDRPDPVTQEWYPAQFDAAAVDNMRRLVEHAGVSGHIYPLALLCYDIMPPPPQVEKDVGEKRIISFHGVGLSVGKKINFLEVASSFEDPEEFLILPCFITPLHAWHSLCTSSVRREKCHSLLHQWSKLPCMNSSSVTALPQSPSTFQAVKAKKAYSQALYDSVSHQYSVLKSAISEKGGIEASTPTVSLSQPFKVAN